LSHHQPFQVTGFHGCDKGTGLKILNGSDDLKPSNNPWDWLADGIYFWEQNPTRALEYAEESAKGKQFNKIKIRTPFVIGAIIELGNCLNLVESHSLSILSQAYKDLEQIAKNASKELPQNTGNKRALDCAVIRYIQQSRKLSGKSAYDTVRGAFGEGGAAYPGSSFTARHHIQICVINPEMIKGYYLPRPLHAFNPHL